MHVQSTSLRVSMVKLTKISVYRFVVSRGSKFGLPIYWSYPSKSHEWSADIRTCFAKRSRNQFGDCCFVSARPTLWCAWTVNSFGNRTFPSSSIFAYCTLSKFVPFSLQFIKNWTNIFKKYYILSLYLIQRLQRQYISAVWLRLRLD